MDRIANLRQLNKNLVMGFNPETQPHAIIHDAAGLFYDCLTIAYDDMGLDYLPQELEAYALKIMEQVVEGTAGMPESRGELLRWAKADACNKCRFAFI